MHDILEMFRRVKQAEIEADIHTMRELFADDATLYEPYMAGTRSGRDVAEYMGTICGTEFAALRYTIGGSVVDGACAAIELTEVVTLLDGREIEISNCTVVERRGGQFIRWHEYLQPMKRKS